MFRFKNPDLPIRERIDDLLAKMTLEEKISQMVHGAAAIPRLDIPEYNWWNECLHGVARAGRATVFPQSIGLAATWNPDLINKMADAISTEARAKHHEFVRGGERGIYKGLTFWSPNINIFRDPRWGRGMETFGEDPYLTGRLAVAFVQGLQGDDSKYLKVVATPKHYAVHSGPEPDRHHFDARTSKRDLYDTYLPAFEAAVVEGQAFSVMGAYNRYMGEACCASPFLLEEILRKKWGFKGYVVSDCGAINDIYERHRIVDTGAEASALAVKAGCDLNCGRTYQYLNEAVAKGLMSEVEIDRAVSRLIEARFRLGMFDPPENVPYARIPYEKNDCEEHRELALRVARESIVLLKNENSTLPLKKDVKSIAVIGPNADSIEVLLGNYNGTASHPVTPLEGVKAKVSAGTKVTFSPGCGLVDNLPPLQIVPSTALSFGEQEGLQGQYFDNRDLQGGPAATRMDKQIDFSFTGDTDLIWKKVNLPKDFQTTDFSVRWVGELLPADTGEYKLALTGLDGYRLYLEDRLLIDNWEGQAGLRVGESGLVRTEANVVLSAGHKYPIKIEYFQTDGNAALQFGWTLSTKDWFSEAVETARRSDLVLFFGGLSPRLEGEEMEVAVEGFKGGDRTDIKLPDAQTELLKALHATGKPVVLVLLSGSALAVNWEDENLPAIVEAWYPGQAGGTAIADVLFGDYNPAGRLPVTFYRSVDQLPPFDDYAMQNRTYRYFAGAPLYRFGFGLSYTSFTYGNLVVPATIKAGDPVVVTAEVTNTGELDGDEVVQLYVRHIGAKLPAPIIALRGLRRLHLSRGETRIVEFKLVPKDLALIDEQSLRRLVEPCEIEISVGGMLPGDEHAAATGLVGGRVTITGEPVVVEDLK